MWWLCLMPLADAGELVVRDRADGDPLPATVTWEGGQTDTNDRGLATVPEGVELRVSAEGYEPALLVSDSTRVVVWLRQGAPPLEVVVEGHRTTSHAVRHVVDGEMALEAPGNYQDAVRLVQSLPGVAVQREYAPGAGDLVIRGASPQNSKAYLDGIEIPYLYHFNQYASVFPASQLDTLELFPMAFGAAYGDATGAIVEARSRADAPDGIDGQVHTSFVMGGADVRAPVGKDWWFSAGGRRSYLDLAGESNTQYPEWPRFHDYNVRLEHGDDERGTGAFVWGAGDGWSRRAGELDALDPVEQQQTALLEFQKGFSVVGGHHRWPHGRTVLAWVQHDRVGQLSGDGQESVGLVRGVSRTDAAWMGDALGLEAGSLLTVERGTLAVKPHPEGLRVADELPWLGRGVAVDDALGRAQLAAYGTGHLQTGSVRWMPGVRLESDTLGPTLLVQPRLASRLQFSDATSVKLGGGRYAQRPSTELWLGSPGLPTTTAWQVSAGVEHTVASRLELGLEAYRKWSDDPWVLPIDAPARAAETGDAYGLEFVSRYRLRERFFVWAWFAVGRSTLVEDGVRRPADGDQPVQGGAVASWDVNAWNFGVRWRYGSGLPWTPLVDSTYDANRDAWIPIAAPDNSDRYPAYQKLDVRTAWSHQFKGWQLNLSAELWIVPRTSAQLYPVYSYDYREQDWVLGPTVFPLLSGRARF